MTKSKEPRSNQKRNPITRFMIWLAVVVFAFVGISMIAGQDWLFSKVFQPMLFFSGLTFTVWIVFEYRRGIFSIISSATGQVSTIKRTENPVLFFFWVTVFLCIGIVFTGVMGYGLIAS